MRQDSIQAKGLEAHVNEYAEKKGLEYRYEDLVKWWEHGEYGEPVSDEWIRRRFKVPAKATFAKWKMWYQAGKSL